MTVENQDGEKKAEFDPVKFKDEVKSMLVDQSKAIQASVLSSVKAMTDGISRANTETEKAAARADAQEDLAEFQTEVDALGLNSKESKAIIALMEKVVGKAAPKVKDEIRAENSEDTKFATRKAEAEAAIAAEYPDVLNKDSDLFKAAQVEYERLKTDDKAMAKSPLLTSTAIREAARKLGVSPLTVAEIRRQQSQSEGGEPGNETRKSGKVTDAQKEFATSFGVDSKKFEAKLKAINAGHSSGPRSV